MAKTDPVDPNVPQGSEDPKLGDNRIRELAAAVAELLAIDHYMGSDSGDGYTEDAAGQHRVITLRAESAPSAVASTGKLYAKDVSAKAELHFKDEDGNEIQLTTAGELKKSILQDSAFCPSGVLMGYGGASAPSGWLLCTGAAVSRTTYADLFSAIGMAYGVGNGSTTFNIPDMRGRVPVGLDAANAIMAGADTLGEEDGAETVTLTGAESGVPAHTHNLEFNNSGGSTTFPNGDADNVVGGNLRSDIVKANSAATAASAHTNMPPYNTVNYIIKT